MYFSRCPTRKVVLVHFRPHIALKMNAPTASFLLLPGQETMDPTVTLPLAFLTGQVHTGALVRSKRGHVISKFCRTYFFCGRTGRQKIQIKWPSNPNGRFQLDSWIGFEFSKCQKRVLTSQADQLTFVFPENDFGLE